MTVAQSLRSHTNNRYSQRAPIPYKTPKQRFNTHAPPQDSPCHVAILMSPLNYSDKLALSSAPSGSNTPPCSRVPSASQTSPPLSSTPSTWAHHPPPPPRPPNPSRPAQPAACAAGDIWSLRLGRHARRLRMRGAAAARCILGRGAGCWRA